MDRIYFLFLSHECKLTRHSHRNIVLVRQSLIHKSCSLSEEEHAGQKTLLNFIDKFAVVTARVMCDMNKSFIRGTEIEKLPEQPSRLDQTGLLQKAVNDSSDTLKKIRKILKKSKTAYKVAMVFRQKMM